MVSHLSLIRDDVPDRRIARIRAGDERTFSDLYLELFPRVMRIADNILQDYSLAEDSVHDVFAIVWETRHTLRDDDRLDSLIFKMVQNNALKTLRHQRVVNKSEVAIYTSESGVPGAGEAIKPPDELLDASTVSQQLRDALAELPEEERQALELRWREELTLEQTASRLQMSMKAVRVRLERAKAKLRAIFRD